MKKLLGWTCALALAIGCAPSTPNGDNDGAGASGASSNDGGTSGVGGDNTSGDGGTTSGFEDGGNSSTGNSMECASEAIEAEIAPLTMFITFDKSGSMQDNNKWNDATAALKAFFADPAAAELEVALRFFPEGGCNEDDCNIGACATPNVPVGALTADPAPTDTQEQLLIQAINGQDPDGATPMSAALQGGIQWSSNYLAQFPDHKVVVILVTDGSPNGCEENIGAIANIAASGLLDGVVTYTVGLAGSNENDLQSIATAGGGSSFFVGNGNPETELLAALQAIRGEQIACEIPIPDPTEGVFNPALVNVTYTETAGGPEVTFGGVANEAACGAGGGWFYDDPSNPETIILCPSTCSDVQAGGDGASLKVVLGCETIPG